MKGLNNKKNKLGAFEESQKVFSRESLSDTQKQTILSNIYAVTHPTGEISSPTNPTDTPATGSPIDKPMISPYTHRDILFKYKTPAIALLVIIALTGTTFASATSAPGELLYTVKKNVLEPLTTSLNIKRVPTVDDMTDQAEGDARAERDRRDEEERNNRDRRDDDKKSDPKTRNGKDESIKATTHGTLSATVKTPAVTPILLNVGASTSVPSTASTSLEVTPKEFKTEKSVDVTSSTVTGEVQEVLDDTTSKVGL